MTSHYRHRRITNPATGFPATIEPGEIAANTANRQIAVGDAAAGSSGTPLILIAVRAFDQRAQYAIGDFVVQAGQLYRAKVVVAPAAFDASQWDVYSSDAVLKQYIDAADAQIRTDYQNADVTLSSAIEGKVNKLGDTMTGPLSLPGTPPTSLQATTRQYVDAAIAAATGGAGSDASSISSTPAGNLSSTNVQDALNELDAEKAALNGAALQNPTATTAPANDNSSKVANTAWYAGQAGVSAPLMDGVATVGASPRWAHNDHIHPTDTSRAPIDSPTFTGTPSAPTAAVGTNSNQLATCAFVLAQPVTAIANGIVTFVKMAASALATGPEFIANAASKILTANAVWAAAVPVNLTEVGVTATPDFSTGIDFVWTLGGAGRTLANPTNLKLGQKGVIYLKQPAGGNATITTWGGIYKFPNNGVKPTLTANANALDVLTYIVKSATEIECTLVGNFA
jgi:hypothetical protein